MQGSLLQAKQHAEQQVAELQQQQQQSAAEDREELEAAKAVAQQALQILTGMCEEGVRDSASSKRAGPNVDHSDNSLPALLDMVVSFASEASTYMQQLSWHAHMR